VLNTLLLPAALLCRTVVHGAQCVLLLALLISEVIIAQHHILSRSSFDGGYQPLLGAAGALHGAQHQPRQQQQQRQFAW
jgi:hypothetical protein